MASFNEHKKISKKQQEMYVALNDMRSKMKKEALNHTAKAFNDEGWTNNTLIKWKPLKRKRERPYTNNKILNKTGSLKNSIKARSNSNRSEYSVTIYSNKVYADIHNWGQRGKAFGKYPFKMPKRQFMGYSKVLDKKLQRIFDLRIKRVFK